MQGEIVEIARPLTGSRSVWQLLMKVVGPNAPVVWQIVAFAVIAQRLLTLAR